MTVNSNSYGTAAEVAAATRRWTTNGAFLDTSTGPPATVATRPSLTEVEKWIDNYSSTLNVLLSNAGFTIPITQSDAKAACAQIIVEVTAEMVHYSNSAGRFYTDKALARGDAPGKVLRQDMADWVEAMASGFVTLGISRAQPVTVSCTVVNPQFERTILDNNSDAAATDEIGVLI